MQWMKLLAAAVTLASVMLPARAGGDRDYRLAVEKEVTGAFAAGDYAAIEKRYGSALASSERAPAGTPIISVITASIVPRATGASQVPGRDDHWIPVEKKAAEWAQRFPQSALAAVVESTAYLQHAWSWRGNGYARTISPEGQQKYQEYVQRAYDALKAREAVGRKNPSWYTAMLVVTRDMPGKQEMYAQLFEDGTKAFPLHRELYSTVASRMVPRWGGSPQAVASIADFAVQQTRSVDGEAMYALIYMNVFRSLDADLDGPDVNWKRIRAGFEDINKRYTDKAYLNIYAVMACAAHDKATTHRLLQQIGDDVEPQVWGNRASYLRCAREAGLEGGQ